MPAPSIFMKPAPKIPRLPEQGQCMLHDGSLPASAYLLDSLQQLDRIRRKEPAEHELL